MELTFKINIKEMKYDYEIIHLLESLKMDK